jgi:acylphosphatase
MNVNDNPKRVWVLFSGHVQGVCFRNGIEDRAKEEVIYGGVQNLKNHKRVWAIFEESQESQGNIEKMLRWCDEKKITSWSDDYKTEVIHKTPPKGDFTKFTRWEGIPNPEGHIRLRAILLPNNQETDFSADIHAEADNKSVFSKSEKLNGERSWIAVVFEGPSEKVNAMRSWCLTNAEAFVEIEHDDEGANNFGLID